MVQAVAFSEQTKLFREVNYGITLLLDLVFNLTGEQFLRGKKKRLRILKIKITDVCCGTAFKEH